MSLFLCLLMLINFIPSNRTSWAIHSSPNHCKKIPITYTYSILTPILSVALTNIFAFLYLLFLKHIRYPPDFLIWFVSSQLHVGLFRFGMNSGHGDFQICIGSWVHRTCWVVKELRPQVLVQEPGHVTNNWSICTKAVKTDWGLEKKKIDTK